MSSERFNGNRDNLQDTNILEIERTVNQFLNLESLTYDQLILLQFTAQHASIGQQELARKAAFDTYGERAAKAWKKKQLFDEIDFKVQVEKAQRVRRGSNNQKSQGSAMEDIANIREASRR